MIVEQPKTCDSFGCSAPPASASEGGATDAVPGRLELMTIGDSERERYSFLVVPLIKVKSKPNKLD